MALQSNQFLNECCNSPYALDILGNVKQNALQNYCREKCTEITRHVTEARTTMNYNLVEKLNNIEVEYAFLRERKEMADGYWQQ